MKEVTFLDEDPLMARAWCLRWLDEEIKNIEFFERHPEWCPEYRKNTLAIDKITLKHWREAFKNK